MFRTSKIGDTMSVLIDCDTENVKLWRSPTPFLEHTTLCCVDCAITRSGTDKDEDYSTMTEEGKHWGIGGFTDQLLFGVPAVPTEQGDTCWGYTSVPQDGIDWWKRLALRG
jgi:hypothetical protein